MDLVLRHSLLTCAGRVAALLQQPLPYSLCASHPRDLVRVTLNSMIKGVGFACSRLQEPRGVAPCPAVAAQHQFLGTARQCV